MSRRLDLGIASYRAPEKLARTIASIQQQSVCDLRIHIFHNPSDGDNATREVICGAAERDSRIVAHWMPENVGYAGAVNALFDVAETELVLYCDNDIIIHTRGWDELLAKQLDIYHELGIVFPGSGAYPINRGTYTECMWSPGFCWMMSRLCIADLRTDGKTAKGEVFDTTLGHQEEADTALRIRLAGYRCGAVPAVQVHHDANSTNNMAPANQERINNGVRKWVDKWAAYFGGKSLNYHSPNVLRWEDWNRLYMEQYFASKPQLQGLNSNPEVMVVDGVEYDVIKCLRLKGFYRGRHLP
jgi:GT2 family glycosyltransferase